jgi:hypothetical protein
MNLAEATAIESAALVRARRLGAREAGPCSAHWCVGRNLEIAMNFLPVL